MKRGTRHGGNQALMISGCLFALWSGSALLSIAQQPDSPPLASISRWIDALRSTDSAVRESASRQLVAAGSAAMDPLVSSLRAGETPVDPGFEILLQLGFAAEAGSASKARQGLDALTRSPDRELSAAAWRSRRELDRRITAKLRELGATVFVTENGITEVKFEQQPVTRDQLRLLRDLPQLTDLSLEQTDLDDAGVVELGDLPALEWLNLYRTRIGNEALRHISRFSHLEFLAIGETRIDGSGLSHVKALTRLEYLGLRGTAISNTSLANIVPLTNLTGIHLGETSLGDDALKTLSAFPKLRQLWLNSTRVSDAGIESLLGLKALTRVDLTGTGVSDSGLRRLRQGLPKTTIIP